VASFGMIHDFPPIDSRLGMVFIFTLPFILAAAAGRLLLQAGTTDRATFRWLASCGLVTVLWWDLESFGFIFYDDEANKSLSQRRVARAVPSRSAGRATYGRGGSVLGPLDRYGTFELFSQQFVIARVAGGCSHARCRLAALRSLALTSLHRVLNEQIRLSPAARVD